LVCSSGGTLGAIISASRNTDFLFLSDNSLRGPLMNNSLSTGSDTRSSTPAVSPQASRQGPRIPHHVRCRRPLVFNDFVAGPGNLGRSTANISHPVAGVSAKPDRPLHKITEVHDTAQREGIIWRLKWFYGQSGMLIDRLGNEL